MPSKRKHGIESFIQEESLEDIRERRKKTQKKSHVDSTKKANKRLAAEVIQWLVKNNLKTALKSAPDHLDAVAIQSRKYMIDWRKIKHLSSQFMDFCASKLRKLSNGDIIQESHENLSKYRSALFFYRTRALVLDEIVLDDAAINVYEMKLKSYFSGLQREEGALKQKGLLATKKGGSIFGKPLYDDTCVKVWDAGMSKAGLFNILCFNTCGRSKNVGEIHIDHFVLDDDCIGIQFPVTKKNQTGNLDDIVIHFYDTPHDPVNSVNMSFGVYFMTLMGGPTNGRVFPGSASPQNSFRKDFKRLFTEEYLINKYSLTYAEIVTHSWRKSALSWLSMASGLHPSKDSLDYRAGHSQDWKRETYYHYVDTGDYELGRAFIAPCGTKESTVLPPHFEYGDDATALETIVTAAKKCFPWFETTPPKFRACLLRFMAAVVYHAQPTTECPDGWIQTNFPDHPVLNTALFEEEGMIATLVPYLGDVHGDKFNRKGIRFRDQQIATLTEDVKTILKNQKEAKENYEETTRSIVRSELQSYGGGLATATQPIPAHLVQNIPSELATQIANLAKRTEELHIALQNQQQTNTQQQTNVVDSQYPTYIHTDETIRSIPKTFTLGTPNVMDGWRFWHRGNKRCGESNNEAVCPFKDIPRESMLGSDWKKLRKTYSDWTVVFRYLENKLDAMVSPSHAWRSTTATHHQTYMMLTKYIPDGSKGKKQTVPTRNSIATVARLIREEKKAAAAAAAAAET